MYEYVNAKLDVYMLVEKCVRLSNRMKLKVVWVNRFNQSIQFEDKVELTYEQRKNWRLLP